MVFFRQGWSPANDLECLWTSTQGRKAKQYHIQREHNEQYDQNTKIFHTHVHREEKIIYISAPALPPLLLHLNSQKNWSTFKRKNMFVIY